MLSLNDITNVSFRKAGFSGYKPEDVDDFIDRVKNSFVGADAEKIARSAREIDRVEEEKRQLQKS